MRRAALVVLAACAPRAAVPVAPPAAGIAIAIYAGDTGSFSVVDDRRWIDVTGEELVLDHVDPGAALASLVIEPYAGPTALRIAACTREWVGGTARHAAELSPEELLKRQIAERMDAIRLAQLEPDPKLRSSAPPPRSAPHSAERSLPSVRCAVHGTPGRYLVRILYVSTALGYHAQHEIEMTSPDRARVTTRFALATPAWHERAEVTLFDGVPGGEHPPAEVARGPVALDGSIAILGGSPRELSARLVRVFDGAVIAHDTPATDPMWARESLPYVWVWLELDEPREAMGGGGPVRVHVAFDGEDARDVEVPAGGAKTADGPLRMALWIDESLRGRRLRYNDLAGDAALAERFLLTVANVGTMPREVWIEEHLRPAQRRRVERAWPSKPAAAGERLRTKLLVRAGAIERVGYTVAYDF